MAPSPMRRVLGTGAGAPQWVAAIILLLAGVALALGVALGAPAARADGPTITVTVDQAGSSATQTHLFVVGKGFPANTAFTYTFGSFDPFQGTTDANGNAYGATTVTWSGSVVAECDTITITAGSASASTSITVGAASDSQTGQQCGTPTSSNSSTPTVDATAAAAASATAAAAPTATTAPAAAPPTDTSSTPPTGIRAKLAKLPLGLIGGGLAALFVVIIIVVAMSRRGSDDGGYSSPGARGGTGYRQGPRPGGGTGYRQAPPRQGGPRGPDRGGPTYGRRF